MPLLEKPRRLQAPPARERGRRLRRLVEARRSPAQRALLAVGRIDQAMLLTLRTRLHHQVVERAAQTLGTFGEFGVGWAAVGLGGAALKPSQRERFIAAAAAGPVAVGINYLVKMAVGRDRPVIEGHPPLGPAPNKLSFPSAHATTAVTAAVALGRVAPGARFSLYSLAALICIGRPYLGMHYPTDVLAGVGLGYGLGRLYPLPAVPDADPGPPTAVPAPAEAPR